MARVPLLAPSDIPADHRAFAEGLDANGAFINLYRAMAHSPVAMRRLYDLVASLWGGMLGGRLREIAILSVVSASEAPYPLGWHLLDADDAGLSRPEIEALVRGAAESVLPPDEAAVASFARALTLHSRVPNDSYQAVARFMDERQLVELTMICGLYRLVACIANGLAVDAEDEPAGALARIDWPMS